MHCWPVNCCRIKHGSSPLPSSTGLSLNMFKKWAAAPQNQQNDPCAQWRLSLVWSESLLYSWRKFGSLATHKVHSVNCDQTGQMPRLIWVFAGRTSFCWFCHASAQIIITKRNVLDINEPSHDKTNKMACAPSEDSDQSGHPPSMIRVFAVWWQNQQNRMCAQQRLRSARASAQSGQSLCYPLYG